MENIEASIDEGDKPEVACRKLQRKLDEIWHKTSDIKRRASIFYDYVVLPATTQDKKKENDCRWEAEFDDFVERWKEIGEGKEEVDWLLLGLHASIEREQKNNRKKQKKTSIEE